MALFGADASKSALYRSGFAECTIGAANAVLLSVTISVSRQLSPVATLGHGIHWAAQPPQGTLTAGSILTNDSSLVSELGASNDPCKKVSATITMKDAVCQGGTSSSNTKTITINDGYCSQLSFTMAGTQGYIGNDVSVMFTSCDIA